MYSQISSHLKQAVYLNLMHLTMFCHHLAAAAVAVVGCNGCVDVRSSASQHLTTIMNNDEIQSVERHALYFEYLGSSVCRHY